MKITNTRKALATVACTAAMFSMTACGSDNDKDSSASGTSKDTSSDTASPSDDAMSSGMVGPGCADYAKQVPAGAGSVEGMAGDKVAVAASNNPLLKTLVAAVSGKVNPKVNLVDALNGGEYTVFAPVDSAFAKLPAETVKALGTPAGAETLSSVLTYHVIEGQIAPDKIDGKHKTLQGGEVTVNGSGDDITVDGSAKVICGGVKTANATVYLIDSVLMPKM